MAVLYLVFRWGVPIIGLQPRAPAPNGQSISQRLHEPQHAAIMPIEPHWIPTVRSVRTAAPDVESQGALPVSAEEHADMPEWVIPLRI